MMAAQLMELVTTKKESKCSWCQVNLEKRHAMYRIGQELSLKTIYVLADGEGMLNSWSNPLLLTLWLYCRRSCTASSRDVDCWIVMQPNWVRSPVVAGMDAEFKEQMTTVCNRGGRWLNILTWLARANTKYKIYKYDCNMKSSPYRCVTGGIVKHVRCEK